MGKVLRLGSTQESTDMRPGRWHAIHNHAAFGQPKEPHGKVSNSFLTAPSSENVTCSMGTESWKQSSSEVNAAINFVNADCGF